MATTKARHDIKLNTTYLGTSLTLFIDWHMFKIPHGVKLSDFLIYLADNTNIQYPYQALTSPP